MMKKILNLILCSFSILIFTSCGNSNDKSNFKPILDKDISCDIKVVGTYDNFEALEIEFDKFSVYYPNVRLSYLKLDDYNNNLSTVLNGKDKPNIFFSYPWMIGNEKYVSVVSHMENLNDDELNIDLDCLRQGLINNDGSGKVLMAPIFSRTYGMLINNNIFKNENISLPENFDELKDVSSSLLNKGYISPIMGYTNSSSSSLMYTIAYPLFVAELANNLEALELANNLDSRAGQYMRNSLNKVNDLFDNECINLEECDKISDNYNAVIFRFFEGDVPMMVCAADVVSGTKKRESQSEAFTKSPFDYSFAPIPLTDNGGYFIDSPSIEFSVNKDCDNLDMTNEFMRFLISSDELNEMASYKGLVTTTKKMPLDSVYSPIGNVPSERTFSPEAIGIKDPLTVQIRIASYRVGRKELTIDEAISMYGSFA